MVEAWINGNNCIVRSKRKKEFNIINTAIEVHGVTGFLNDCEYEYSNKEIILLEYRYINKGTMCPIPVLVRFGDPNEQ